MELVYKKSFPLTQQFMSNFGLVGQLQKTSLFMTLRNMSTRSMMTSWSMEFVGLTNGLITILLSMVMDPQHYQVCVVFSWDNFLLLYKIREIDLRCTIPVLFQNWLLNFIKMACITIGGRLLEHTKSMQLVRSITYLLRLLKNRIVFSSDFFWHPHLFQRLISLPFFPSSWFVSWIFFRWIWMGNSIRFAARKSTK